MESAQSLKPSVQFIAVIMAGSRSHDDPVARAAGQSHKCLVEVAGVPMLIRVLETLESSSHVGRIVLCIEKTWVNIAAIEQRLSRGTLERLDAAGSPAASAMRACDRFADAFPLLIVTADHPLLNTEMLHHFCTRAAHCGDVAVALARAELVLGRYQQSSRTLLKFSDGARCGCNMFALNTAASRTAVSFWTRLENHRKRPWRLIRMLGAWSLLRYLCGFLSLTATLAALSQKLGIDAQSIEMPFAEAAIDVDKHADLNLVEAIFRARESK